MDSYTEQIIEKKPNMKDKMLYVVATCILLAGVIVIGFVSMSLGILVVAVACFAFYYANLSQNIEYEYIFTNGDCDIAEIKSKETRKEKYAMKESEVTCVMKYSSDKCKNELEVNAKLAVVDFTSGKNENENDWYVFIVNDKKGSKAVVLELDEKNVEHIGTYYKKKMD